MAREHAARVGKLYKRGKIWWYQHRGERTSTQCHDRQAAEAEAKNIERRLETIASAWS